MDRPSKKSRKSSKVEKTKKCETSEQRAKRHSPFKAMAIGIIIATAGVGEATMSSNSIQHSSNSLPEGYVPPAKNMEQTNKLIEEIENPSTLSPKKLRENRAKRGLLCCNLWRESFQSLSKSLNRRSMSSHYVRGIQRSQLGARSSPTVMILAPIHQLASIVSNSARHLLQTMRPRAWMSHCQM